MASSAQGAMIAKARAWVHFRIAFYCSTRAYWNVLRRHDLEWLGERVNPLAREPLERDG
jgi:hypothetical protein